MVLSAAACCDVGGSCRRMQGGRHLRTAAYHWNPQYSHLRGSASGCRRRSKEFRAAMVAAGRDCQAHALGEGHLGTAPELLAETLVKKASGAMSGLRRANGYTYD